MKHIFISDFNYANYFFWCRIYLLMYVRSMSIYKGIYHWHEGFFGVIIFYFESSLFFYLKNLHFCLWLWFIVLNEIIFPILSFIMTTKRCWVSNVNIYFFPKYSSLGSSNSSWSCDSESQSFEQIGISF